MQAKYLLILCRKLKFYFSQQNKYSHFILTRFTLASSNVNRTTKHYEIDAMCIQNQKEIDSFGHFAFSITIFSFLQLFAQFTSLIRWYYWTFSLFLPFWLVRPTEIRIFLVNKNVKTSLYLQPRTYPLQESSSLICSTISLTFFTHILQAYTETMKIC